MCSGGSGQASVIVETAGLADWLRRKSCGLTDLRRLMKRRSILDLAGLRAFRPKIYLIEQRLRRGVACPRRRLWRLPLRLPAYSRALRVQGLHSGVSQSFRGQLACSLDIGSVLHLIVPQALNGASAVIEIM